MPRSNAVTTRKVAVVLPAYMVDSADIVRGIVRYTRSHTEIEIHDLFFQDFANAAKKLARGSFHGAITSFLPHDFESLRPKLPTKLALVNIGADSLGLGVGWIRNSDEAVVQLALNHLRESGFERLALVGTNASAAWQQRSTLICQQARPQEIAGVFDLPYSYLAAGEPRLFQPLEQWLAKLPPRLGIIAWHGLAARCVCLACEALGRAIPRDVGILSLLDERWCLFGDPPISATRYAGTKLGFAAMKLLDRMLQGRKAPQRPRELAPRCVVVRRSTRVLQRHSQEIANALAFIKENACQGITVKEVLAATQTVSRRKFYNEFEAQVGHAPAEHIRQEKITRAKELLRDSTLTVRRIAELCGFTNVTRFQVQFRQLVGQTPLQFRRRTK